MQLKTLYVKGYKNLNDFNLDFSRGQGFTMLIGNNGSGKSNVLEAISAIFHDAYKSGKLYFGSKNQYKTDYEITYQIDDKILKISCVNGIRRFFVNEQQKRRELFIREGYLPHNVIGVYSGEENRLWISFYEQYYKSYINRIKNALNIEHMKLLFINKYYWNVALLVLIVSQNENLYPFIEEELGIYGDLNITITFNIKNIERSDNELLIAFIRRINPKMQEKIKLSKNEIVKRLYEQYDFDNMVFQYFVQSTMPKNDKFIKDITIQFNGGLTTEVLSEGEKKLILVKAVMEFLADEKTLILFDEPDAHIHEAKKHVLYDMMLEYPNRQIVMTTHSPTFIDLAEENQITMLRNNEHGNTEIYESEKLECIRHLTGSRFNAFLEKPILYCEGTDTSIEGNLYPLLFPDYNVIPSGGHEEVIHHTKTYNHTFGQDMKQYAIGVIDQDYQTDEYLEKLKNDQIYALNVVEVENILMDTYLLQTAQEDFLSKDESVAKVKKMFIKEFQQNIEKQATKYTSNYIVSEIKYALKTENRNIERFKNSIKDICDIENIDHLYQERINEVGTLIEKKEYDKLIKMYDFNHSIDHFNNDIVNDYTQRIIRLINKKKDLQCYLIKKYYKEIPVYPKDLT